MSIISSQSFFLGRCAYLWPMGQTSKPLWPILKRGLRETCPKCGQAPLFRAYLKPVDHCAQCGQNWANVRADDGPAWASMLIAGHLVAPLFHYAVIVAKWPTWLSISLISLLLVALCLILLPRMKGLFMAIIWAKDVPTS